MTDRDPKLIEAERFEQQKMDFVAAGWSYTLPDLDAEQVNLVIHGHQAPLAEGATITVAFTLAGDEKTHSAIFVKQGNEQPPEGLWRKKYVYEVKNGNWNRLDVEEKQ